MYKKQPNFLSEHYNDDFMVSFTTFKSYLAENGAQFVHFAFI